MSSSSLRRQLILTVAALLIAVFAAGGATYAWFALNQSVTADGLQISATTEGVNYEITAGKTSGYVYSTDTADHTRGSIVCDIDGNPITDLSDLSKLPSDAKNADGTAIENIEAADIPDFVSGQTTASISASTATLLPTHPVINSSYSITSPAKWYHALSNNYDESQGSTATQYELTTAAVDSGILKVTADDSDGHYSKGNYALIGTFYIRLNPEKSDPSLSIKDVKVTELTVSGAGSSDAYASCVSVLAAGKDGADIVYNVDGKKDGTKVIVSNIPADGSYYQVDIYCFFEGTDDNCKSSKYSANDMSISVNLVGTLG